MNVEPELRFRADGDRLVVELGNEVAFLDPARALALAFAAIEVGARQRGAIVRLCYWIEQVSGDLALGPVPVLRDEGL